VTFAILILAAVLVGDYAYYLWPDSDRPWVAYIGQGLQAAIGFAGSFVWAQSIHHRRARFLASAASAWGVIEAIQRAVCGAILFGEWGSGDLCRRAEPGVYPLAAAVLLATLIAVLWSRRHGR